ncbi:toprim domain-containing protein [Conexibacter sp. W3-3-2]|uniref:toprim domain-containing protein n=1 Tax=Conexibacter sp. W3-3-2 TaxID=2675227 RepID=UPI0018AB8247|nr:toprim domain-containing protein [Conexibacter sp. W3-3-2]
MDLLISCGLAEPRRTDLPRPARQKPTRRSLVDHGAAPPKELVIPDTAVATWAKRLAQSSSLLARLEADRAIGASTVTRFAIGYDGRRVTIPVRDADGGLAGVLRWLPFDRHGAPKMLALPGSRRTLFPAPEHLPPGAILLCEGEPDALAAHTARLLAVAIPGVAAWRPAWATRFAGRAVTVVMDCDDEGRACARRVALDLGRAGITAQVVDLDPGRDDGHDLTDHLLAGGSINELRG